jgi:hypothetical protein
MALLKNKDFTEESLLDIYKKYTINDFFTWWQGEDINRVMEVRISDYNLTKAVANKFNLPWCSNGIMVSTSKQLRDVIAYTRNKQVVWYGINPRKKNWSLKVPFKTYGSGPNGGSADANVSEIAYIMIDIDRRKKDGPSTSEERHQAYILAKSILKILHTYGWANKYYIKCSGNGIQIGLALDVPIAVPELVFNKDTNRYEHSEEFENVKRLIKEGFGEQLKRYQHAFLKVDPSANVEIDSTSFNISRVCALHATTNRKYNPPQWRGLLELVDNGTNEGLTDYLYQRFEDKKNSKPIFKGSRKIDFANIIRKNKLDKNPIAYMLLNYDFPNGGINNTLWFQLKILLRDSRFDLNTEEFRTFYKTIQQKHNRTFTLNIPEDKYRFNSNVVNNYCMENMLPLAYPVKKTRFTDLGLNNITNINWSYIEKEYSLDRKLPVDTTIIEDILSYKSIIKENTDTLYFNNHYQYYYFLKMCIDKYGLEKTKYLDKEVLRTYFQYD